MPLDFLFSNGLYQLFLTTGLRRIGITPCCDSVYMNKRPDRAANSLVKWPSIPLSTVYPSESLFPAMKSTEVIDIAEVTSTFKNASESSGSCNAIAYSSGK